MDPGILLFHVVNAKRLCNQGSPSAYCEVSTVDKSGKKRDTKRTFTVKKESDPVWDSKFTFDISSDIESIELSVYNREPKIMDQLIGYSKISYQDLHLNTFESIHLSIPEKSKIPLNIPVLHQQKLLKSDAEIYGSCSYIDTETKLNIDIEERKKKDSRRRMKEIAKLFDLNEDYIEVFSCIHDPLHKGKIYLTENRILFKSAFKQKSIALNSIKTIELTKRLKFHTTCTIICQDGSKSIFNWIKHLRKFLDELKKWNFQIIGDVECINDDSESIISSDSNSISGSPKSSIRRRLPSIFKSSKRSSSKQKFSSSQNSDDSFKIIEVEPTDSSEDKEKRHSTHLKNLILSGKDESPNSVEANDTTTIGLTNSDEKIKPQVPSVEVNLKDQLKEPRTCLLDDDLQKEKVPNKTPLKPPSRLISGFIIIFLTIFNGVADFILTLIASYLHIQNQDISQAFNYAMCCSLFSVLYLIYTLISNLTYGKNLHSNSDLIIQSGKYAIIQMLFRAFLPSLSSIVHFKYKMEAVYPLNFENPSYIFIVLYFSSAFTTSFTNVVISQNV